jgi:carboxylesterase type B
MGSYLRDYFVSFALWQTPNNYTFDAQAPNWPAFSPEDPQVLYVENDIISVEDDPDGNAQCRFWDEAPVHDIHI